jgi:hypothetical protein
MISRPPPVRRNNRSTGVPPAMIGAFIGMVPPAFAYSVA